MGDLLLIRGSVLAVPPTAATTASGDLAEVGLLDERVLVGAKTNVRVTLPDNNAFTVPILRTAGGPCVAGANVLFIVSTAKVRARLTSADGSTQAVPVDGFLSLISLSVPITALDLMRVSGAATTCQVFLAERITG